MKTIKYRLPKYLVLKNEDIEKYLSDEQKKNLEDIKGDIHGNRWTNGKKSNLYLVLNTDEPYAQQVWDIMNSHGHVLCSNCDISVKEIFCTPQGCLWHKFLANAPKNEGN